MKKMNTDDHRNIRLATIQALALQRSKQPLNPPSGAVSHAVFGAMVLFSSAVCSQSLDEAVNEQLEFFSGIECGRLLNGDATKTSDLKGGLLNICTRGAPTPGIGPSASTGGIAATPASVPSIVQKRLREARGETEKSDAPVSAASADTVTELGSRFSLFTAVEFVDLDREVTRFEDGYDSDIWRLTIGLERQVGDRLSIGLAADYYRHDGSYTGGGDFDNDSYGMLVFASIVPADNVFVQLAGGYSRKDHYRTRAAVFTQFNDPPPPAQPTPQFRVDGLPDADYDADQYTIGLLGGLLYPMGSVIVSPQIGMQWHHTEFDTYREGGNSGLELTFIGDDETSVLSSIGAQLMMPVYTDFGSISPQVGLYWMHEFDDNQDRMTVSFVGDDRAQRFTYDTEAADSDWSEFNLGFVAALHNGTEIFGNYRTLLGHSYLDSHAASLGLRVPF